MYTRKHNYDENFIVGGTKFARVCTWGGGTKMAWGGTNFFGGTRNLSLTPCISISKNRKKNFSIALVV